MDRPIKILVVEDSLLAQAVAKKQLTACGCIVDIADSSNTALAKSNSLHYDAILMDLGLYPGPTGFEISKWIKTQSTLNKETPVIALSAHYEAQYYKQFKEAGISGFISKPFAHFEATEFVRFIKESLGI